MPKGIKGFQKGNPWIGMRKGAVLSDETKKKIGLANSLWKRTPEQIDKLETYKIIGRKMSIRQKGKPIKITQGFQKGHQIQVGEKHWAYKKIGAHKTSVHDWIKKRHGFPPKCEHCGLESENHYKIQWANVDHKYSRDIKDWKRLCVSCHMKMDNHSQKIWITRRKNMLKI